MCGCRWRNCRRCWRLRRSTESPAPCVDWGLRMADYRVPMPETSTIVIGACAVAIAMVLAWQRRAFVLCGIALLAGTSLWVSAAVPRPHMREGVLEVTAIDVGQGDSLLVVSPQGKTLLIDAGGPVGGQQSEFDFGENVVSPYLWERRISHLDVVVLSHAHSDHIGGIHTVLKNFVRASFGSVRCRRQIPSERCCRMRRVWEFGWCATRMAT